MTEIKRKKRIRFWALCLNAVYLFSAPCAANGTETIILNVTLNQEVKGEFFVDRGDGGDFLLKKKDLQKIGFVLPPDTEAAEDAPVSLKSLKGVSFVYNEKTSALEITAEPELLQREMIDFSTPRQKKIAYPNDNSLFVNYGLQHTAGNSFAFQSFTGTSEVGARFSNLLFLSDATYTQTESEKRFARLNSSMTYDRREQMERLTLGDFYGSSGNFGSTVNMAGFSYSKNYLLNPYFIKQPVVDYSGLVSLPSEVDVYIDGVKIKSQKLSPGGFDLKNIVTFSGTHDMELVFKDAFGREQHLAYPFYVTSVLLRAGYHEYSYNAGVLREKFGTESNSYSHPAFLGFHRYGLTNSVTVGFRGETANESYNFGPQLSFAGLYGVIDLSLAESISAENGEGYAGSAVYTFQGRRFNARALFNAYTRDYSLINTLPTDSKTQYEIGAGVGYGKERFGSISADYTMAKKYQVEDRHAATVSYSRDLSKNFVLSVSQSVVKEDSYNPEFMVRLTYFPRQDTAASVSYKRTRDSNTESIQLQKNAPLGEGFGYSARVERTDNREGSITRLDPYVQYNGRYGIYSAEYTGVYDQTGRQDTYMMSASGAVAYAGGETGFTRPIYDSFAVVKVGNLSGVNVYQNNMAMGITDSSGKLILPSLESFNENLIKINDKDVPINYALSDVSRFISQPYRSGSLIRFDALKTQAFTGMLKVKAKGEVKPVEYTEVRMSAAGKEVAFPTGRDGEFYFENAPAGSHPAEMNYLEKTYRFSVKIPKSEDMIVNLGDIIVEIDL